MKLDLTLPERPGLLHAVPILNIFALLLMFLLLGPSMLLQSGVAVDLPPSRFQLERFGTTLVVTLAPGEEGARIHLGREPVTIGELSSRLGDAAAKHTGEQIIVLLQSDAGTPVGFERQITELILSKKLRLALVGANAAASQPVPAK